METSGVFVCTFVDVIFLLVYNIDTQEEERTNLSVDLFYVQNLI